MNLFHAEIAENAEPAGQWFCVAALHIILRILRAKKHTHPAWEILLDFHPINHPAIAP